MCYYVTMKLILNVFVCSEAHVIHIVDGVVHRVQCFMVVSVFFILSKFHTSTLHCVITTTFPYE